MGGVVFSVALDLFYLPASVAIELLPVPAIARVPGAPEGVAGVALVHGSMLPVFTIGTARSPMLLCSYLGERMGLVGLTVVACGRFEGAPAEGPVVDGAPARLFDLAALVARVREARWVV